MRYSGKYICIYAIAMLFDRSWWSFIVINNFRASSINYLAISRCLAGKWILHWPQPRLQIYFTLWSLFGVLYALLLACNFFSVCLSWVLITHSHKYVVMIFVYTNNLTRTKRKTIKMNYAPAQSVWMLRPRATETMCYSPFCVGPLLTCHQSLWRNDIQRLEFIPGFSPLCIHIRIRLCAFECHNTNFVCMFELMN